MIQPFLARVGKVNEAAVAVGLPPVLPLGFSIVTNAVGVVCLVQNGAHERIPFPIAESACAWLLRQWCNRQNPESAPTGEHDRGYYLAWADEIITVAKESK